MNSLFDPSHSNQIIARINKLTSDSKAEWGKMNVSQMLSHAEIPLRQAMGEIEIERSFMGKLMGGFVKKKIISEEAFKKNLPTDKKFIIKENKDFDKEKSKLIKTIEKFTKSGPDGLSKKPHPFFGNMTPTEWDTLMYKHLDHHLRQFGV